MSAGNVPAKRWTHFMDMHSGGGRKLDWEHIFIEAPKAEAEIIFQNRFGRNPNRVTCTCCGEDYSVSAAETLESATWFERGCLSQYRTPDGRIVSESGWYKLPIEQRRGLKFEVVEAGDPDRTYRPYKTLSEYLAEGGALVIRADEIKDEERKGDLREEGYVWRD